MKSMHPSLMTVSILTTCLLSSLTFGVEIEVDPTLKSLPQTIQEALNQALPGDTVIVPPGIYVENLTMASQVVLKSKAGPYATVIDGDGYICINCEGCTSGTRISGFTITNGGSYTGGGVRVFGESSVEIDHNIIRNNETDFEAAGVLVQRNSEADIHDNGFHQNSSFKTAALSVIVNSRADIHRNLFLDNTSAVFAGAIGINESTVRIFHNVFADNTSGGIGGTIDVSASQATITNNTFLRNRAYDGGTCVSLNTGSFTCALDNNLAAFNAGPPVVSYGGCQNIACNIFWENGGGYVGACPPSAGSANLEIDPLLCDPDGNMGEVADNSPCFSMACDFIGANPSPGCSALETKDMPLEETSWGSLKASFR